VESAYRILYTGIQNYSSELPFLSQLIPILGKTTASEAKSLDKSLQSKMKLYLYITMSLIKSPEILYPSIPIHSRIMDTSLSQMSF
jgi:hypothetical protein